MDILKIAVLGIVGTLLGIMLKEDDNRVMLTGSEAGNAAKGTEEKMEITDMMKIPAKEMA